MPVDPTADLSQQEIAQQEIAQQEIAQQETQKPQSLPSKGSNGGGSATRRPAVPPKIKSAFKRYKVAAFVVGWGLLILCAAVVLKYAFGIGAAVAIWGPIHGALFVVYVIIAFDLAYKDRWSPLGTIWVLIAGTIPFVSFIAESQVQRKVLARQKM